MSTLDKLIEIVSPERALKRAQNRAALRVVERIEKRSYNAASHGRRTANWHAPSTSANRELEYSLRTLRNRSRDMVRNNSYAKKAIDVIDGNTIGTGIRPAPWEDGRVEAKVKKLWAEWGETTKCDWDEQLNFYGIQGLIIRTVAESGECLVLRRRNKQNIPVQLQVLEPDYLDPYKTSFAIIPGQPFDFMGVQFDGRGKRVGYWLYDTHPSEGFSYQSRLVPAEDVIHVYLKERPGQARGVPWGVQSFVKLRDLGDYQDAQLIRQKIAACFSIFVHSQTGADVLGGREKDEGRLEKVEPGIIEYLSPGEEMSFATPPAAEGYQSYTSTVLHEIAAGYGITYEAMTGDFSGVNFSSGRMGWLEMSKNIKINQHRMMIPMVCDRVWEWFVEGAQISGLIRKNIAVKWTPPRREMIDPVKEVKGMAEEVANGFASWPEKVRENGYDPDDVIDEMQDAKGKLEKNGLVLPWMVDKNKPSKGEGDGEEKDSKGDAEMRGFENLKTKLDAYGVGVRAGAITPTQQDEELFRQLAKLPDVTDDVKKAWIEDGGIRRPLTIKTKAELEASTGTAPAADDDKDDE